MNFVTIKRFKKLINNVYRTKGCIQLIEFHALLILILKNPVYTEHNKTKQAYSHHNFCIVFVQF